MQQNDISSTKGCGYGHVTFKILLLAVMQRVARVCQLFCQLSRLKRYERILFEIVVFEMGLGHFEQKIQGEV